MRPLFQVLPEPGGRASDSRYFFDLVELVQRFERRERVDVESLDFVADLLEYRIVQLEHRQLHAAVDMRNGLSRFLGTVAHLASVGGFHLFENLVGPAGDLHGHAGHFGYMDTERVFRPSEHELAQEDDLAVDLPDRHVVVLDPFVKLLHFVELVVVRGEERFGAGRRVAVDVFDHRPRDGNAVVGTRAPADFVQQHEAALGNVVQDAGPSAR